MVDREKFGFEILYQTVWIWSMDLDLISGRFEGTTHPLVLFVGLPGINLFCKIWDPYPPKITNSSPLKIGHPKRKQSYSNHPFSGVNSLLVSGRVILSDSPLETF